jgi:hypothetical protein
MRRTTIMLVLDERLAESVGPLNTVCNAADEQEREKQHERECAMHRAPQAARNSHSHVNPPDSALRNEPPLARLGKVKMDSGRAAT